MQGTIINNRPIKQIILLLLILLAPAFEARADVSVYAQQARIKNGRITVYFDVVAAGDKPVSVVSSENISLFFDDRQLEIDELMSLSKSGEGIATVLLVDVSRSMSENHFDQLKKALEIWVDSMTPQDMTALLSFGESVENVAGFTNDRTSLKEAIEGLQRVGTETRVYEAVIKAYETAGVQSSELPSRRAVVALSDGIQEAEPTASREDVLAEIRGRRVPFYSIAYTHRARNDRERELIEKGLDTMKNLSDVSGGVFYPVSGSDLLDAYARVNSRIKNGYAVYAGLSGFKGDDRLHDVRIEYKSSEAEASADMDVAYMRVDSGESLWRKYLPPALLVLAALSLVFVPRIFSKKKQAEQEVSVEEDETESESSEEAEPLAKPALSLLHVEPKKADGDTKVVIQTKPKAVEITLTPVGDTSARPYVVRLTDRLSIGRGKDCKVRIADDPGISAKHCELLWSEGKLYVRDLGSTNGTSVNGVPIKGLFSLNDGDCLGLGRVVLRLGAIEEI